MRTIHPLLCLSGLLLGACGNAGGGPDDGLPRALPFAFTRAPAGLPASPAEVGDFTRRLTGAWKAADFFRWLDLVTYGVPRDNPAGMPYFANFWNGALYVKQGARLTFQHTPNHSSDNASAVQASLALNAMFAHMESGDGLMAELADELARGLSANIQALVWDAEVPPADRHLMARYIIPHDFEVDLGGGRSMAVDYSGWRQESWGTFSDTIHVPANPTYGDIWARNKRSKDDICDLYRLAALLPYGVEGFAPGPARDGLAALRADMQAFAADVLAADYHIRTRDHDGSIYVPSDDFAALNGYVAVGECAECTARLATNILATGSSQGLDCGDGRCDWYEALATASHLYNFGLIRMFHVAALLASLVAREDLPARRLLEGLSARADSEWGRQFPGTEDGRVRQDDYDRELAGAYLRYAQAGLPLTAQEAAFARRHLDEGIALWAAWPWWDMWDPAIPDGTYYEGWYDYHPYSHVLVEDMTAVLALCGSPFKNPAGEPVVDCAVVLDPARWGAD